MEEKREIAKALPTPMDLIVSASSDGAVDVDKMQQLFELQMRWEASEAKKEYNKAIASFKAENIKILKNSDVKFGNTHYKFAKLDHIVNSIVPVLTKYGLTHSWGTTQEGDGVTVICKLSHYQGHSEETSLTSGPDTSGNKNNIQAIGSAVSYLQRYTLMSILGLASGEDDDGAGANKAPVECIGEGQQAEIQALIDETGTNENQFLAWLQVDEIENIPTSQFRRAVGALEKKRGES